MKTPQRQSPWLSALLFISNLLIPVSLLIFATGFFPYKPFLPGLAQYEVLEYGAPPAPFDRLIFMVVDALRSDFVYLGGNGFEFTQQLIRDGNAIPFTANARSPTVTMPRIKAITTGSIPSFLDVILNFDEADTSSTLAAQDTWLAQMKAKDSGKLIMFGDDTWLKLFPETFDRADGTASFFVADFTEVDNNVTRHIADELEKDDWNTMILHYLGLDHIGHKAGPRSPNMIPKQREMDGIVKKMYEAIESRPSLASTLIVLCGDHGMNDAGNHGASSAGETSTALVFASPKLAALPGRRASPAEFDADFRYYAAVEQSDIAPTLAALLGFPVPRNNLGAFITDFLPLWGKKSDMVQILVRNARQVLEIATATFGAELMRADYGGRACADVAGDAEELACLWQEVESGARATSGEGELDQQWVAKIAKWLRQARDLMSSMASNYDMPRLFWGQGAAVAATAAGVTSALVSPGPKMGLVPLAIVSLLYGIMMFASSYVEEEHHFWYWMASGWFALLAVRQLRRPTPRALKTLISFGLALCALRLVRGWNQTGQKHAGEPDLVKIILLPNPQLLWGLIGATYLWLAQQIYANLQSFPPILAAAAAATLAGSAFSFKLAFASEDAPELVVGLVQDLNDLLQGLSLVHRARVVFTGIAGVAALAISRKIVSPEKAPATSRLLHALFTLLAVTQSRVVNVPVFLFYSILFHFLESLNLSVGELSTSSLLLQYASFFSLGGTNAISSVDLSSAYNGIRGFNIVGVGVLTFISNWAGPMFWTSATTLLLLRQRRDSRPYEMYVAGMTAFAACSVAFVMAACTVLRTHLFIWTVFSPKYLYVMAWSLGQHLLVNIGFGGLLYWVGTW